MSSRWYGICAVCGYEGDLETHYHDELMHRQLLHNSASRGAETTTIKSVQPVLANPFDFVEYASDTVNSNAPSGSPASNDFVDPNAVWSIPQNGPFAVASSETPSFRLAPIDAQHWFFRGIKNYIERDMPARPAELELMHEERIGGMFKNRPEGSITMSQALSELGQHVLLDRCTVTSVLMIDNAKVWARFNANRDKYVAYFAQHPNQMEMLKWLPKIWGGPHVMEANERFRSFPMLAPYAHGEFALFSGSGLAGMNGILRTGFDPSFCSYSLMTGYGKLGYGVNFTDQFSKAASYALCPKCKHVRPCDCAVDRYVFCARVLLGNTYRGAKDSRKTRNNAELTTINVSPVLSEKQQQGQASITVKELLKKGKMYNSVIGSRTAQGAAGPFESHTFVIADGQQAYPEFLIGFRFPSPQTRTVTTSKATSSGGKDDDDGKEEVEMF